MLRTSEFVAAGHPDKMSDIIADTVLDLAISKNKHARVACEVMLSTDEVIIRGEIGGVKLSNKEIEKEVRNVIKSIGYMDIPGFSYDTVSFNVNLVQQSSDIAQGVIS